MSAVPVRSSSTESGGASQPHTSSWGRKRRGRSPPVSCCTAAASSTPSTSCVSSRSPRMWEQTWVEGHEGRGWRLQVGRRVGEARASAPTCAASAAGRQAPAAEGRRRRCTRDEASSRRARGARARAHGLLVDAAALGVQSLVVRQHGARDVGRRAPLVEPAAQVAQLGLVGLGHRVERRHQGQDRRDDGGVREAAEQHDQDRHDCLEQRERQNVAEAHLGRSERSRRGRVEVEPRWSRGSGAGFCGVVRRVGPPWSSRRAQSKSSGSSPRPSRRCRCSRPCQSQSCPRRRRASRRAATRGRRRATAARASTPRGSCAWRSCKVWGRGG